MQALGRRKTIYLIAAVIALGLATYGVVCGVQYFSDPYRGLVTSFDVQMSEETRMLLTQRVATARAAIAAKTQAGEVVEGTEWYDLALDIYTLGDLIAAREAIEESLNVNANHAVAWNTYANVLTRMGDLEAAEDAYQQALRIKPTEAFVMDYARFLQTHFSDRSIDILELLEDAVKTFGQKTSFMLALGDWYMNEGNCDQALAHYKIAAQADTTVTSVQQKYTEAKQQCSAQ